MIIFWKRRNIKTVLTPFIYLLRSIPINIFFKYVVFKINLWSEILGFVPIWMSFGLFGRDNFQRCHLAVSFIRYFLFWFWIFQFIFCFSIVTSFYERQYVSFIFSLKNWGYIVEKFSYKCEKRVFPIILFIDNIFSKIYFVYLIINQ